MSPIEARQLHIQGRVQGIGFRPELYRRAMEHNLTGWVQNDPCGVIVHIEGEAKQVDGFVQELRDNPPPLAEYTSFQEQAVQPENAEAFIIKESKHEGGGLTDISPDLALCEACQHDLWDAANRRFQYPFTTCTYCGPRYTFIENMPYDRPFTTMAHFPLCPDCQTEYGNPLDRRFHAQPIACPTCGPRLRLYRRLPVSGFEQVAGDPIEQAREALLHGAIVAIKGLGGYHLAAAAHLESAVSELRRRKKRPDKPLALMMKDMTVVKEYCECSEQEQELLTSQKAPILLLPKKETSNRLAVGIAPKSTRLGVMLPYTPLHHLLLNNDLPVLVMTSANLSGQPLIADESVWFEQPQAAQLIDCLLTDNRPIANPLDDSVVEWQKESDAPLIVRRARGYVPESFPVSLDMDGILAVGAEQHAAFALGRGSRIYQGPYTGTLSHVEIQERYLAALDRYKRWYGKQFTHIACDMHPQYWSSRFADTLASDLGVPLVPVQHHHAHMAAVMAEHGLSEECFAIVLDGTGFGLDDTIWGMEILHGDYGSFQRVASLASIPLIGGETAIKETWRIAAGMLANSGQAKEAEEFLAAIGKKQDAPLLLHMLKRGINTPLASSCGRLFDGVSALLGICQTPSYDAQAAIELTEAADRYAKRNGLAEAAYSFAFTRAADVPSSVHPMWRVEWAPMLGEILRDKHGDKPIGEIASRFHATISKMLTDALKLAVSSSDAPKTWRSTKPIVLAGGSIQNRILLAWLTKHLSAEGFGVYHPKLFPAGDGGIAVGQLAVASAIRSKQRD